VYSNDKQWQHEHVSYTRWLKNTQPDKVQFLDNRVRFLYPHFLIYTEEILQQLRIS